ncbi:BAF_collapsed_G0025830.mRNA.1.CDS.1 [Saccharomyces cerevisiae]|nr:CFA_G0025400.mRNA.1.CDS.1 [Saccharomyces cerevisiae]CAI4727311.1 CDA_G0043720.mRNA.1.CDS.1 [Saccharomyces cerevisiae]CAI5257748.1 BAF_HP2_G0025360.mRNA.1.CDS.1 [Saccharomyces cerevisiae]CAI6459035.1 BAF_HP2_G0025360.mRNA.1.CDS.1 [Saccharomyces cerevisiae]CAI6551908.1 BAF_HP1_G0025550.mRNA.1.CDS.1 [Saccharomyces cerevisiae]
MRWWFLYIIKVWHATWSRGSMSRYYSPKLSTSFSFLLDKVPIKIICIYGCVYIFKSSLNIGKLNCWVPAIKLY